MDLDKSIDLIRSFFVDELDLGQSLDTSICASLEKEKGLTFPPELKAYINTIAPNSLYSFAAVGNSIDITQKSALSWTLAGYNHKPMTNEAIPGWKEHWFLIANEGADPIIVDLENEGRASTVYKAIHGAGSWDFSPIADSIAQFLVCAAALHHALQDFDLEEPIIDDEDAFNLAKQPAQWLFPFIKKHAEKYDEEWLAIFDNY